MTKAEEKAVEYQVKTHGPNVMGGANILSEDEYMRLNMNYDFKAGYEEAEKDLALTVDDIELIDQIMLDLSNAYAIGNFDYELGSDEFYKETLKRFNEFKAREK